MSEKSYTTNENDATRVNPVDTNSESLATSSQRRPIYEDTTHMTRTDPYKASLDHIQLEIGSVISGKLELVALLGEGGMGKVFKALNRVYAGVQARNPYVAIKVLKPELSANEQLVRGLYSDFDRTSLLANCPNIIKVHGFDSDPPYFYMTMEYLSGKTLGEYLKGTPLSLAQAWFIIEGIGNALAYAHENNIVHRDIKPGNVIITNDNIVKVLDFGIASKINEHEGDETKFGGHELGALTVAYASPEMSKNYSPDPRDDIYAFACVIYEILTGKQFYKQRKHKAERIQGLNSRQMEALNKALTFERDQRIGSIRELLDKLRPVKTPWVKYVSICAGLLIILGLVSWGIKKLVSPPGIEQASVSHTIQAPVVTTPPPEESKPAPVSVPAQIQAPVPAPLPVDAPAVSTQAPTTLDNEPGYSATSSDGIVHLQTSKPDYKNGESFRLSFELTQPMYVRVIDRDVKGVVTMLRPNPRQPDKLLPAGKEHIFPPKDFNAPVKGPSGNSTVTIVASGQPISKGIELLNDDGSVSEQVQSGSYSWTQVRYALHR